MVTDEVKDLGEGHFISLYLYLSAQVTGGLTKDECCTLNSQCNVILGVVPSADYCKVSSYIVFAFEGHADGKM